MKTLHLAALAAMLPAVIISSTATASSHREAPAITSSPRVDGTDLYMFRSYETGREDYITILANYLPLQDAYGGPNYFRLDPSALYEIHIDNNGDALEDLTFQFRFNEQVKGLSLNIGPEGNTAAVAVPLTNIGPISAGNTAALNVVETYSVSLVRGDRRTGARSAVTDPNGGESFAKPVDNIGNKSIGDYPAYAASHIHDISIPGCATNGRVFVGQRQEGFVVNLGETFDLVNIQFPAEELDSSGNGRSAEANTIADKNVTTLALELPISCLTTNSEPVIGAWTTASLRQARMLNPDPQNTSDTSTTSNPTGASLQGGAWTQVSRLGMPLVNEVVIGLPDKDLFNASEPADDGQFATYVTNPALPELLEILFGNAGVRAPNNFPRADLIAAFLTGVPNLNQPANVVASEMLRLNTSIAATPAGQQNDLGVLGGDNAGFPNGRRPIDDVVDAELRVAMGVLCVAFPDAFGCNGDDAPSGGLGFTDGALPDAAAYGESFPYLADPLPGSIIEPASR